MAALHAERSFRQPVVRISQLIRERYWDELTRTMDDNGMAALIHTEKQRAQESVTLYVPESDPRALEYYVHLARIKPEWKLKVRPLLQAGRLNPREIYDDRDALLTLGLKWSPTGKVAGVPFVVPSEHCNEMRGWDSYFIVSGLLKDGRVDLARSIVDNCVYEIQHYGAVLSANQYSALARPHPSFLTSMAIACYGRLPRGQESRLWLTDVVRAVIDEYRNVWMHTHQTGADEQSSHDDVQGGSALGRRPGGDIGTPFRLLPEATTPLEELEKGKGMDLTAASKLDKAFRRVLNNRKSRRPTHDKLLRGNNELATVELNSILYKLENDVASILAGEFRGTLKMTDGSVERAATWRGYAANRKKLIRQYLWNPHQGMFLDYDCERGIQGTHVDATSFYPLWAGVATQKQARRVVESALPLLEASGGLAASSLSSRVRDNVASAPSRWDYPYGWAPHQMILWQGLIDYGYIDIARRLAYKWVYGITIHALRYDGGMPDKFDVERRSHTGPAESEDLDLEFSSNTRGGFGWTNASYQVGVNILTRQLQEQLNRLVPPEFIF